MKPEANNVTLMANEGPGAKGGGEDMRAMDALQGNQSVAIADVVFQGQRLVIGLRKMGGGQSDLSVTLAEPGKSARVISRVNSGSQQTVAELLDNLKQHVFDPGAEITAREIKTVLEKQEVEKQRATSKDTSAFKKRFNREPTPTESGLFQSLQDLESVRYKTANQEKQIEILTKQIESNPDKWIVGDGVGYRVGRQINRGFRIVDVDPEAKTVVVRQVADTGLTSSGGDFDKVSDTVVRLSDLVRDKKYDYRVSQSTLDTLKFRTTFDFGVSG